MTHLRSDAPVTAPPLFPNLPAGVRASVVPPRSFPTQKPTDHHERGCRPWEGSSGSALPGAEPGSPYWKASKPIPHTANYFP